MMCWPSSVTVSAIHECVRNEGVDERPVDVVQLERVCFLKVGVKADDKVHAVGQRRDANTKSVILKVRSSTPSIVHSFAAVVVRPAEEARAAGSTASPSMSRVRCELARPLRQILMVLSNEPVITRSSGTAATPFTVLTCPESVTTSPENGRRLMRDLRSSERVTRRRHCSDVVGER